jgi:glutaredoxin
MTHARLVFALLVACAAAAANAQQLYRWTDAQGRVNITDTPPPPGAKDVQQRSATGGPLLGGEQSANTPFAVQLARKNSPVTLYTGPNCEACDAARKLLNARGIPFSEISVNDQRSLQALKQAGGSDSVPVMVVGTSVAKGFEPSAYNRTLDIAGYPAEGAAPARNQAEPKVGETAKPAATEGQTPRGPYAPGAPRQPRMQRK